MTGAEPRVFEAYAEHLCELLRLPRGARVLDAGCGSGHASIALAAAGCRVTAIDLVEETFGRLRDRATRAGVAGRIETCRADAASLPFEASSFDAVVLAGALTNMEDPGRALAEAARVLTGAGALGVGEWLVPSRAQPVFAAFARLRFGGPTPLFDHAELLDLLRAHGFQVDACRPLRWRHSWSAALARFAWPDELRRRFARALAASDDGSLRVEVDGEGNVWQTFDCVALVASREGVRARWEYHDGTREILR